MLDRLAEIGMEVAEALRVQILALAAPAPAPATETPAPATPTLAEQQAAAAASADLVLALTRAGRAVRQSLALKPKLAEDWRRGDRQERALAIESARRIRRKDEVRRAVEQAILERPETATDRAHDKGITERLLADLHDRLDAADISDEFDRHKTGAIVAGICRDLRLPPVWDSWQTEPWFEAEGWGESEEDEEEESAEEAPIPMPPAEEACTPKPLAEECVSQPWPRPRPHELPPTAAYLAYLARVRAGPREGPS